MAEKLVVIVGPTAVGKSAVAVDLAQKLDGEIISGDSVQVYRRLNIGSAKITHEEQQGIPHHMLDVLDPDEEFSVAKFQTLVRTHIDQINRRGKIPILVGGTGLYIRSILDPYEFPETSEDRQIRAELHQVAQREGKAYLHRELAAVDPESAARLHVNDLVRVVRALEVYRLTGRPFSDYQRSVVNQPTPGESPYHLSYFGLNAPREWLYERINQRVELMLAHGLVQETQDLLADGYVPALQSLRTIGYRHAILYLRGLLTRPEMKRLLQRDTRHFAKRQLTWFRRDARITWFEVSEQPLEQITRQMTEIICSGT
ncbi:MAG: tRNA (adenosine(37)-N6)-dimethylallyltransferase MiaA [Peptococcaceae bacterium]|nr:tRNA (adenosine(37)-N6)-dimethylallyltransferase MiaA [Peptococcaceae bacterium]